MRGLSSAALRKANLGQGQPAALRKASRPACARPTWQKAHQQHSAGPTWDKATNWLGKAHLGRSVCLDGHRGAGEDTAEGIVQKGGEGSKRCSCTVAARLQVPQYRAVAAAARTLGSAPQRASQGVEEVETAMFATPGRAHELLCG